MSRVVFLLEEYSMKVLLDGLLPRLFPELPFLCVPHEGKQDLEKSIPQVSGARRLAQVLTRENRSRSFQVLIAGIEGLAP